MTSKRGGKRPGAGRPPSIFNKRLAYAVWDLHTSGITRERAELIVAKAVVTHGLSEQEKKRLDERYQKDLPGVLAMVEAVDEAMHEGKGPAETRKQLLARASGEKMLHVLSTPEDEEDNRGLLFRGGAYSGYSPPGVAPEKRRGEKKQAEETAKEEAVRSRTRDTMSRLRSVKAAIGEYDKEKNSWDKWRAQKKKMGFPEPQREKDGSLSIPVDYDTLPGTGPGDIPTAYEHPAMDLWTDEEAGRATPPCGCDAVKRRHRHCEVCGKPGLEAWDRWGDVAWPGGAPSFVAMAHWMHPLRLYRMNLGWVCADLFHPWCDTTCQQTLKVRNAPPAWGVSEWFPVIGHWTWLCLMAFGDVAMTFYDGPRTPDGWVTGKPLYVQEIDYIRVLPSGPRPK